MTGCAAPVPDLGAGAPHQPARPGSAPPPLSVRAGRGRPSVTQRRRRWGARWRCREQR
ncbi:hypothetical protein ACFFX0_20250 [Citricoccus parietis]|uniref:Uncharacterized protein n=1 Tax=Citricoccus parietis TaxID=592307 RepID=A0ABV5G391_9MICC